MKTTLLATILFASFALTSCSDSASVAGNYVKNNPVSADAQGATNEGDAVGDSDPAPATPTPATPTPSTPAPATPGATPAPATPAPATPTPGGTPAPATPTPAPANTTLTYANVNAKIFTPYCTVCHGNMGGVNLETYAKVKASAASVKAHTITKTEMPPGQPLSAELQKLLGDWIAAGTPEK